MGLMDFPLSVTLYLVGLTLLLVLFYVWFQENKFPGPKPLPFFGNLFQLDFRRPYVTLLELSKRYGSVFAVYFGPEKVVVLSGLKTVKEALVKNADTFGERQPLHITKEYSQGYGIIWSNGDSWKEMRRFALSNLKDYGMGKKVCEDKIIDECQYLIAVFEKFNGEAFDMTLRVSYAVSNIICSMVYGRRFDYDDPEFRALVQRTYKCGELLGSPSIQMYNLFPWLGKCLTSVKEVFEVVAANKKQNLSVFRRLKETLNPQMCRGLIDAFLVHKQHLEESGSTNAHFNDQNLLLTVMHLFAAGTGTTSITLRWGILFMVKYPNMQNQVQEEISRVVGSRQVQVEDRKNLPFTNAVVHETQRRANVLPTSLPHRTSQDVTFQGHFIKKGTTVYPLLSSVLYDETEWEKPLSFYPAHFLDKDGKFVNRDAFMPFSAGRRACPGESLARMEIFLFFTTLLQNFNFCLPPGLSEDDLHLTPTMGLSLRPPPYKLRAVSRR